MQLLLEKASRYWQIRFLAIGVTAALVIYALVMPVHSNESVDDKASAAKSTTSELKAVPDLAREVIENSDDASNRRAVTGSSTAAENQSKNQAGYWIGENQPVATQLSLAAQAYAQEPLPRDYSESILALRSAAMRGSPTARFLLGHAYQLGIGVPKDIAETARWYHLAEEAGQSAANTAAKSAPRDFAQALEAYRQAAEHGDVNAELYFALAYDAGQDVPRSLTDAARWYRKAAERGSVSAASNLGILFLRGDGVPKDSMEAATWFGRAAAHGSATAQYSLGRMYEQGDGVPQSYAQAATWLESAAANGYAPAQVLLSAMVAAGQGVPPNIAKAYMWINLASATEEQAKFSRDQVEKMISAVDVADGQKLTHEWLNHHVHYAR